MRLCTFQVHLPWEPSEERALDVACQQWQTNLFGRSSLGIWSCRDSSMQPNMSDGSGSFSS